MNSVFETVIGIEVHAQLWTKSKLFSRSSTAYGQEQNLQASVIDLGMPGVLPVLNEKAVHQAIIFGLAVEANINQYNVFDRKNYFYPDLPKGYQISQLNHPIIEGGHIDITTDGQEKTIALTRAHLEEDAGKLIHDRFAGFSAIDLNRAGTPLLEIVSEPEISSADEAVAYLKKLHHLMRFLGICDGNMQEGSFRADINLSVREKGSTTLGTRTELKNLNSFRFIHQAIEYETQRQIELIENGEKVVQQTRLFDPNLGQTYLMRSKENADDYRYFPDPDLLPVEISDQLIKDLKSTMRPHPQALKQQLADAYGLGADFIKILTEHYHGYAFFAKCTDINQEATLNANWICNHLQNLLQDAQISWSCLELKAQDFASLMVMLKKQSISVKNAKEVLAIMLETGHDPKAIIAEKGLEQMDDSQELERIIEKIITDHPEQVSEYKSGKTKLKSFFIGQIMRQTKGKAAPDQVQKMLSKWL